MSHMIQSIWRWFIPLGLYVVYNSLFLIPEYYFKRSSTTFFPTSHLNPDPIIGGIKILFIRDNADLFRFIGEIIIWVLLLFWISKWNRRKIGVRLAFTSLFLLLLYHWYYLVSFKIYGESPNILNDLTLMWEVLPLFLRELGLFNVLSIFGIIVFFILLYLALWFLVKKSIDLLRRALNPSLAITSALLVVILGVWSIGVNWSYNPEKEHPSWRTLHWITPALISSVSPVTMHDVNISEEKYRNLLDKPFKERPNLYLFFLESYGSVVQLLEEEGPLFEQLMNDLEVQLNQAGWGVASTYSLAPVIGGRSWLSFTSALTGLDVNNHLFFNELLAFQYNYPHLVRLLKRQGYFTYRMKTMSNQKQSTDISYSLTDRFYGFDEWVKYDDIPYRGFKYDMLGGIPDQYAVNHFIENILDPSKEPFFFFSINMSSHAPWNHTPPLVDLWKMLDTITQNPSLNTSDDFRPDESMRYFRSIEYVLKVMIQFILEKVDPEAIIMLVGDHQPPGMTFLCEGKIDEFSVPLHIITQNEHILDQLYQRTFTAGLNLNIDRPIFMSHKDIYDLWLDILQ